MVLCTLSKNTCGIYKQGPGYSNTSKIAAFLLIFGSGVWEGALDSRDRLARRKHVFRLSCVPEIYSEIECFQILSGQDEVMRVGLIK